MDVRAAMYALADRYLLLSPEEFAGTGTLLALGEHILPSLMAQEADTARAALSFVLHAVAPPSPKAQQVNIPHSLTTSSMMQCKNCTFSLPAGRSNFLHLCLQALRAQLEQWLSRCGEAVVQALLFAACDTCPRHLLRNVATPLRALLDDSTFREAAQHWLVHAASQPNLPGVITSLKY